jgi:hypothetical protein
MFAETLISDIQTVSNEILQLARQLKALSDADLHKRRIKSTIRDLIDTISELFLITDVIHTSNDIKEKTKAATRENISS